MKSQTTIDSFNTETFKQRFAAPDAPWFGYDEPFKIVKIEAVLPFLKFPFPIHRTALFDILFVTQGAGAAKHCGLTKYSIDPPQLFFKGGGQITSGDVYGTDTKGYFCLIQADFLTTTLGLPSLSTFPFFHLGNSPLINLSTTEVERFSFLFTRLHQYYQSPVKEKEKLMASYLHVVVQEAALMYQVQHAREPLNVLSSAEALTARFCELVNQFYLTKQRISQYADLLSVTPNHLNKAVKQTSGKTASSFIVEMIMMEAKVLLKQSLMSVADIAFYLHFDDVSYFIRFFRNHCGLTPLDYRKMA
ncbi:helix-turn-helix domain-containing protein [Spirosoma endbachense]|uniref:Helix-turn-helix domain-containing protein n=1 Tax=Spirosoma endbachense TaxID=2666025 RepID=A0A6P1VVK7_9BACT|nr:helix-turn-helix transcriptional regulator [Spirosoma endbachense]QHV95689.1 helix-turn-helix domain-containing protein [Spirosoma endbachense]